MSDLEALKQKIPTDLEQVSKRIDQFIKDAFPDGQVNPKIRVYRFLEEAIELAQSLDVSKEDTLKLVDYVYGRPVGDVYQECEGTSFTLLALLNALNLNIVTVAHTAVEDAYSRIDKIREKNKTKPKAW